MRCGWAKRTSSPIAGPGRVHAPVLSTIKGPNRHICSVRSAPNAEPAPPSCCRPATPKLCSFTSMRSQPKSRRARTLFSSSIKPGGMAPRPSRFQTTSRSCSSRHVHPNSTAKKISGNSCGRTGCRTEFSNPSTTSSITAATPGTPSSISRGKSCPSPAAIGQPQVTQSEDWYYLVPNEEQNRHADPNAGGRDQIPAQRNADHRRDDRKIEAPRFLKQQPENLTVKHSVGDHQKNTRQRCDGNPRDQTSKQQQCQQHQGSLDDSGSRRPPSARQVDQCRAHRAGPRHSSQKEGRQIATALADEFAIGVVTSARERIHGDTAFQRVDRKQNRERQCRHGDQLES